MNFSFITYIAAAFVVLLEIALVVLLISRKENRGSKLYRCVACFAVAVLAYCLLYFYFYFQDMLGNYAVVLPLRILDYLLDASIFFFWLRFIGLLMESSGKSKTHVFVWSWIIGILRAAVGVGGTCLMDAYYAFANASVGTAFSLCEGGITLLSVIVIGYYALQLIRLDTSHRHRQYVGFVSVILCLWTMTEQIVSSFLYTGQFISAWAEGIPDSTAISVFIIGLATFLFVFQEDFSPLFYAAQGISTAESDTDFSDSSADAVTETFTDPLEIAAAQHGLTVRELDVLRLVYEGKNNPEIAEALFISRNTVKKHLQSIYEKTGVNSRMELVYVINLKSQNH